MKIQQRVVVISGASSGVGRASAKRLAERGGKLALLARNAAALAEVTDEITRAGGQAKFYTVDLADAGAVEAVAENIGRDLGVPDIVINNAGAGLWRSTEDTPPGEVRSDMAVPYFAAFNLTRVFLRAMLDRGTGHVVNVTSPAAYFAWPGATSYGVARWAMRGFSEHLRADLYGTGLKVSLVCLGRVDTPYFVNNPGSEERMPAMARLYRTLTAEEAAEAILFAVEKEKRDVVTPFLLRQTLWLHRVAPALVERLTWRSGYSRPARSRTSGTK